MSNCKVESEAGGLHDDHQEVVASCPFCRSYRYRLYEVDTNTWAVFCSVCNAIGPHGGSKDLAIQNWTGALRKGSDF